MKISEINSLTAGYASSSAKKTGNAAFDEALTIAGKEKKIKLQPLRREDYYLPSEEEKLKEKNPKCMEDVSTCSRCEHRKECKTFKDDENKKENKEPNPFSLDYFPKKFTSFYQRYLIMDRTAAPKKNEREEKDKKDDETRISMQDSGSAKKGKAAAHTVAQYLKFYYNTKAPGEGKND